MKIMVRNAARTLALISLFWLVPASRASLVGTTVTGVLNGVPPFPGVNFYDPASGDVPATGFQNSPSNQDSPTVTIVGGDEFGFGLQGPDTSFSATGFAVTVTAVPQFVAFGQYQLTLTDSAFQSVSLTSNTFPGLTYEISGDVITINIPLTLENPPNSFAASFAVNAVPEPSSFSFLLVGAGAFALRKSVFERVRWAARYSRHLLS
jgi:hypothetical protein